MTADSHDVEGGGRRTAAERPGSRPGPPDGPTASPHAGATRSGTGGAALIAVALAALIWWTVRDRRADVDHTATLYWRYAGAWALFAAGAWLVHRLPPRGAVLLIVAGGILIPLAGLGAKPQTSDDSYRYAWDGRVQASGISPYRYTPVDPALRALRDPWLFPATGACTAWDLHPARDPATGGTLCTRINRPQVPTIYPPVAEGYFAALDEIAPAGSRHKGAQTGGLLLAVATTGALLWALRRTGGDPRHAVYWAWCPAVALEAVNNAHVDTLGALLTVLGLTAAARRGHLTGGALIGAAIATKLLPALVLPGVVRRRPLRVVAAAAAVLAFVYTPYVAATGVHVIGYLPGYLKEEGYQQDGRNRFALLRLVMPGSATLYAGIALLIVTALLVMRHADAGRPWRGALVMTGAAMVTMTPSFPWYMLLIVALVALDGRWEWLAVPPAATAVYLSGGAHLPYATVQRAAYGSALALVAVVSLVRHRARVRAAGNGPVRRAANSAEPPAEHAPVGGPPGGTADSDTERFVNE